MDSVVTIVIRPTTTWPRFILILAAMVTLLMSTSLQASQADEEPTPVYPSIRTTAGGVNTAGVAGGEGEVSGSFVKTSVKYKDFSVSYQRLAYSWDNINQLPFGNGQDNPWEDLHTISLGYSTYGTINANWKYFAGTALSSSFEKELTDSYGAAGFAGATYIFSPTLQFTLGGGLAYHDIKTTILPVIGVSWNQGTPKGLSIALGYPETYITYRFDPQWAIRSRIVQFEEDVYRLADDSTVEEGGFLERRDLIGDLGLEYAPIKNLTIILAARYYFDREFTIHDETDSTERSYDVDNAWGGVASVNYKF